MADVLVAYASKYGSTKEVAETIAGTLREQGLEVTLEPADEVRDLEGHAAVVLGGGLYMGRWHRDTRAFLRRHKDALASLPVAVFALGPQQADEEGLASSKGQLRRALARAPFEPRSIGVFGGVVDPGRLPFPLNRMPASDARDWDAIRAWAAGLPGPLGLRAKEGAAVS